MVFGEGVTARGVNREHGNEHTIVDERHRESRQERRLQAGGAQAEIERRLRIDRVAAMSRHPPDDPVAR